MATTATRPIVLVPGYEDNAGKLAYLAAHLRQRGAAVHTLSPQPSDGSLGIDTMAGLLATMIEETLGTEQPFDLFGFSMGGLIARYYLQQLGGAGRVREFVTLATPHQGTWTAKLVYPARPAVMQMAVGSSFLAALNGDLRHLAQVNFVALWTPFDLTVTPPTNSYLPDWPEQRVYSPFHGTLLMDPWVLRTIGNYFLDSTTDELATAPVDRVVAE